jgi:hypothetical protein
MVRSDFCWSAAATRGFVIFDSGNPVVDSHEVGILGEFGVKFACTVPLSELS